MSVSDKINVNERERMMHLLFSPTGDMLRPSCLVRIVEKMSDEQLLDYAEKVVQFRCHFGTSPLMFLDTERDIQRSCSEAGVRYVGPRPWDGPSENMARRDGILISVRKSKYERRLRRRCEKCGVVYVGPSSVENIADVDSRVSDLNTLIRRAQARTRKRKNSRRVCTL